MEKRTLLVILFVAMMVSVVEVTSGVAVSKECKREKSLLVRACRSIIYGRHPSPKCCRRVRVTHPECVCPYLTPQIASLINVTRTINQIQDCGRTVPHHFKCGKSPKPSLALNLEPPVRFHGHLSLRIQKVPV
ncbi:Bifunctional inhibitor/plant lipid transfer protein/seed storage helical domain [Dillenia turbinata]|uniref:Bifunctional inhibitor/plant lipid transfer protein/seed storage helical domain n=1 Tax=Dillenia turbinata TaxID=194707 RepID=A0AAN8Z632_9MAGN